MFVLIYRTTLGIIMKKGLSQYYPKWNKSITIGSERFIEKIKDQLGVKGGKKQKELTDDTWLLHDPDVFITRFLIL